MGRVGSYNVGSNTNWTNIGSVTTSQAALTATQMATATAEALTSTGIIKFAAAGNPYAVLIRVRSDGSENDSNVLQLYQARVTPDTGADYYSHIGQLTCLQGQAAGASSTYFADSITPANENTMLDCEESPNTLANQIGTYYWRTLGCNKFFITASTLTSTTVYIDVRFLYE